MRKLQLTEKVVQTLREMVCGVEINNDIQMSEYEIEKLKYKMNDIEYNALLKLLDSEKLQEIIQSRSVYDDTVTLVERIKTTFNVKVENEEVLNKLANMQAEIDMRQQNIDKMFSDLLDLTTYSIKLQEKEEKEEKDINNTTNEFYGITFNQEVSE